MPLDDLPQALQAMIDGSVVKVAIRT
jgi:hypothetical protein